MFRMIDRVMKAIGFRGNVVRAVAGGIVAGRDLNISVKVPCLGGRGPAVSVRRDVGLFEHVDAAGSADVEISFGPVLDVSVNGEAHAIESVGSEVSDGRLALTTSSDLFTTQRLLVRIVMPTTLRSISLEGAGDVVVTGIDQDEVTATLAGAGDMRLSGRSGKASLVQLGSGDIRAERLKVSELQIVGRCCGDIDAHASHSVDVVAYGSGDINIRGGATKVASSRRGSGDVRIR